MGVRSSTGNRVYKFVHRTDEYIRTNLKGVSYEHEDGWLKIEPDGTFYFRTSCQNGYAWDGCSPKWELMDFLIGTPDCRLDYITQQPMTFFASMTHDIFYQFKKEVPISRKTADVLFRLILRDSGFKWTALYYFFVRRFGGIFFGKWKQNETPEKIEIYECSWVTRFYNQFKDSEKPNVKNSAWMEAAEKYHSKEKD